VHLPIFQAARIVHCYLAIRSEVDPRFLLAYSLASGKRVIVPIVQRDAPELAHSWLSSIADDQLEKGVFGVPQPRYLRIAYPGQWELTIVPMLAFDREGHRLGYGKGHYDRLLKISATPTIGLAFAAQEIEHVPHEAHDMRLDWVVTDQEVIKIHKTEE
jgi:5-formyltetrahydrofolate cyclo-ligase